MPIWGVESVALLRHHEVFTIMNLYANVDGCCRYLEF